MKQKIKTVTKYKIKKGDQVIVRAGKDKGRQGKVLQVVKNGTKLIVEGINMIKKHVKPNPQLQQQGGIVEREAAIVISNVGIMNPATSKADRIGYKMIDGVKRRYFKSNDELIDV